MGCFGCKKSTFKGLDNNNEDNDQHHNHNNNNNKIEQKFRSRSLRGLDNRDGSRRFRGVCNDHDNNDNNIASSSKSGTAKQEKPVTLEVRSNVAGKQKAKDPTDHRSNVAGKEKAEDLTDHRSNVAGKEKAEDPTDHLLSPRSKGTNLKHKLRTDSRKTRSNVAATDKESSPTDLLKDERRKRGALRTGSNVAAKENEDNSANDLSQKLKDDTLSQDLKDTDLKNDRRTKGKEAHAFKFDDLAEATGNFRSSCFLGEGGFGKVYKGRLDEINQDVAIKQLDRMGSQGIREFVMEVLTLSLADHPNLVKLLGFCVDGDNRLLVYEYMPLGSLERYLHDLQPEQKPLDWNTRMKIASGAARGLRYLHEQITPPVIYRDLKCANILLGEGYHPKLSDFGLAKVGPSGNKTHVSTRVMGTYGYCAPDYALTGQLNFKSDIYSFGVVLLELITGRKAFDHSKSGREQSLVAWARPLFKDRKKFPQMADPLLEGKYPIRGLYQVLAIAAMCIQEKPAMRPDINDVVNALNFLANQAYNPTAHAVKDSRSGTSCLTDEKDPEGIYFSLGEKSSDDDDHGH